MIIFQQQEFLVKWEGYPDAENTWEPRANLTDNIVFKEFIQAVRSVR